MIRRNIRLRKEYLYKKSLEGKQKEEYEKKERIRKAIEEGKELPTELRGEAEELKHTIDLEDKQSKNVRTHMDDEYATAGIKDPKVCVTTSREPSARLKQFVKEIKLIIPNSQRINRGNTKVDELVQICRAQEYTDIVIVGEHRGEPDQLIISHLPYGPTCYISLFNSVMRHDIENVGTMSEVFPHLIFNGFTTSLGERVTNIFKYLYPVPKADSKRVISFVNQNDIISFRHHNFTKNHQEVELKEVGPRFDMRIYKIKLGTVDMEDCENEYVYRPFMNTAKRRKLL